MHKEIIMLHKTLAFYVVLLVVLSAVHPTISRAFILDRKDDLSYCPDEHHNKISRIIDDSCLNDEFRNVLKLSKQDIASELKKMNIEHVIDLYLCAWQAGLDKWEPVAEYVLSNISENFDYLMHRIELERDDERIVVLLVAFAMYGYDYCVDKMKAGQVFSAYDDLIFSQDRTRFLVTKAEALKDCGQRNFLLDYLIPLLPTDEAMAKQDKREEEARKKSGK